ncbi:MAG: Xanthine phosphoribosyltransferase 1 [Claussenomyces sp. TS43310]|nr:MAG: Xanthine phosphoribosyltransferase 1 [Claussenomyces sp. TS43310]
MLESKHRQAEWQTARTRSGARRVKIGVIFFVCLAFWQTFDALSRRKLFASESEYIQTQVLSRIRQRSISRGRYQSLIGGSTDIRPIDEDDDEEASHEYELQPEELSILADQTHQDALDVQTTMSETLNIVSDPSLPTTYPSYPETAAQHDQMKTLPDVISIPFEDAVADVVLAGWEDEWFANAHFDAGTWGNLAEPKIDFVYTWVNGSEVAFQDTKYPYELESPLNDPEGTWLNSHGVNRYRDWDELRYSVRTVERFAQSFRNKIQILVNSVGREGDARVATLDEPAEIAGRQKPLWIKDDDNTKDVVEILTQEEFFDESEAACLPTFNSLAIESQIYNTKSTTDRFFALSDDMFLGKPHAASDLYSPLFGPTMGFKIQKYNTRELPSDQETRLFGEKPYLIYTSWLLNQRFGERPRKGQVHFGHSLSRSVMREAIKSFPGPARKSTCQRFRGELGSQLYPWYVAFHYTIERHREALLWSYIMLRADANSDGNLDWTERQAVMADLDEGLSRESNATYRVRQSYRVDEALESAGLERPKVNLDTLWTSLDGPSTIHHIHCPEFKVNECLATGFSTQSSDEFHVNPVFSSASIFERVTRQIPSCGDCLLKLILNRVESGLEPLLPHASTQAELRQVVIKALAKYQYTIVEPDALFVMVTDAPQVQHVLLKRIFEQQREVGQLCLNDDVASEDEHMVNEVRESMMEVLRGMAPEPSIFEVI